MKGSIITKALALILCSFLLLSSAGCSLTQDQSDTGNTDTPDTSSISGDQPAINNSQTSNISFISSYSDLGSKLSEAASVNKGYPGNGMIAEDSASPESMNSVKTASAADGGGYGGASGYGGRDDGSVSSDFSHTNVQVDGIDEGDIVKTDGEYIYVIQNYKLIIYKADGAQTAQISSTAIGSEWKETAQNDRSSGSSQYPSEMFILGDRLAIISNSYSWLNYQEKDGIWHYENNSFISLDIYDVSNPSAPQKITSLGQDGSLLASRLLGGKVYLVSNKYVYDYNVDDPGTYVPNLYRDGVASLVDAKCIGIVPYANVTEYTVVSIYDLESAEILDTLALLGGGNTVYMNGDNLYLARSIFKTEESAPYTKSVYSVVDYTNTTSTGITRISLTEAALTAQAECTVPGYLVDQFALDESSGYLRAVTTVSTDTYAVYTDNEFGFSNYKYGESSTYNALYILDSALKVVGSIENLAKDEIVYSVRFSGDIGYFCTFRRVDPLFAADLSDPANPKILSALKISGFSNYLHSWSDGQLLGLGYEADEKEGATEGIKLVMFDVSDPANVSVQNTASVNAGWSVAMDNHKAILVDPAKNLFAFPADNRFLIYSYDEAKGFTLEADVTIADWSYNSRGLYIDNYIYILDSGVVYVLDMSTYAVAATVGAAG